MKLSLDALLVLDAIERRGSFAAAAADLARVPSALTYTVRKLEEDLDVLLFDRSGHRARLTPAGIELLDSGRQLLRAVEETERRVKRIATGWESELRIAVDTVLPLSALYPLMDKFYREGHATRLRFSNEVLAGSWEAMKLGRADMVIGAPGPAPAMTDCRAQKLGDIDMVFAVAPAHPLAKIKTPLTEADIFPHRVIAVADSSRQSAARTHGILSGQAVLTVPDMQAKLQAQRTGLGVGNLPRSWLADDVKTGRLLIKPLAQPAERASLYLLIPKKMPGKALKWWQEHIMRSDCLRHWLN